MTRISTKLLVAAAFCTVATVSSNLHAGCHGRSGGYSYGGHSPYRVSSYHRPTVTYSRPAFPQSLHPSNSLVQLPQQQFPQQQLVQIQQGQEQGQLQQGTLNSLAVPSQQFNSPQLQQMTVPQQTSGIAQNPVTVDTGINRLNQGIGSVPQQIPSNAAVPPTGIPAPSPATPGNNAELSALQALGGFAPPQNVESEVTPPTTPIQQSVPQPSYVGRWTARLSNGASVQLLMQSDGSFTWSATNKSGSTSQFQGTYLVERGQLTLIRSSDNQKLSGSMTTNSSDAFSFRLAENEAPALDFQRG